MGNVLEDSGRADEALECYRHAIALKPDHVEAICNLAAALRDRGNIDEAVACYRKALAISGAYPQGAPGDPLLQLLAGDLAHGWEEYESRWHVGSLPPRSPFASRSGTARTSMDAAYCCTPSRGSATPFISIRYASMVQQRGGRVILECQPALARLLRHARGVDQVVAVGDPLPAFDTHLPLLSLPRIFRTTLDSIPRRCSLSRPARQDAGGDQRPAPTGNGGRHIGIVWAGSESNPNDRNRSCPPVHFKTVAERPGVMLYSLQKGPRGLAPLDTPDFPVTDLSHLLTDFHDTAMAVRHLDLIITVDTAVAHLAGALGRPVWVLLPFAPDWRWLLNRKDSPWYPRHASVPANLPGDWAGVFARVVEALDRA